MKTTTQTETNRLDDLNAMLHVMADMTALRIADLGEDLSVVPRETLEAELIAARRNLCKALLDISKAINGGRGWEPKQWVRYGS